VLLILSRLIRATVSVFFIPCCPVLLSFYLVLSYMFELNKWNGMESNIALCYGVEVNESSFYCSTVPCLYLMQT